MFRRFLSLVCISSLCLFAEAQLNDSIIISNADTTATAQPSNKHFYERGVIGKVYEYFRDSNREKPEKKFDIGFIGGPHYSSEEGFGIGVAGSGSYRAGNFENKNTPKSNITLKLDVTTGQLYKIAAEGFHIFEGDKYRINYDVYFYSFADKWWGVGYNQNSIDANESKYKRLQSQASVDFVWKLHNGVFLGPLAQFSYVNARDFRGNLVVDNDSSRVLSLGVGATFVIDTRDIPTCASKGVHLRVDALTHPSWLANNKEPFYSMEANASTYCPVWTGGILAFNLHTRLTWGDTPWCLLSSFGGGSRMRGYWDGRYRDKMEGDFTVELRQHIWRRNGIVIWGGAGQVFPRFSALRLDKTLPSWGVGYRWEFKKGVNVRLDLGFGKHDRSINFSLNEAF